MRTQEVWKVLVISMSKIREIFRTEASFQEQA